MKITLEVDLKTLRRFVGIALFAAVLAVPVSVIGSQVGTLITFQAGTTIKAADVNANFQAVATAIDDNDKRIGDLTQLQTTAKTNLVAAVNEVKAAVGTSSGGTVTTDATLTGNGSGGSPLHVVTPVADSAKLGGVAASSYLQTVTTDTTLTGNGTGASALGVNVAGLDARYLQLTGGTLTGSLVGTDAFFKSTTPLGGGSINVLGGSGGAGLGGVGIGSRGGDGTGIAGIGITAAGGIPNTQGTTGGTGLQSLGSSGFSGSSAGSAGGVGGIGVHASGGSGGSGAASSNGGEGNYGVKTSGGAGGDAGATAGNGGLGAPGVGTTGGAGGAGPAGNGGMGGDSVESFGGTGGDGQTAGVGGSGIFGQGGKGGTSSASTGGGGGNGVTAVGGPGGASATVGGQGGVGVSGFGGKGANAPGATGGDGGDGIIAQGGAAGTGTTPGQKGLAGNFQGNVQVIGTLVKGGGSFKIDHPLDPENKFLYHSFVESPDMKNLYDGIVALDAKGEAVVQLPAWFTALNRDFRYQLTCVGGHAPVYVADEVRENRFRIAGGREGLKVSWQVTGTRQDAFANAHRIEVEVEKKPAERGLYLHPTEHGKPENLGVYWERLQALRGHPTPRSQP
jgi:hypothetical protein